MEPLEPGDTDSSRLRMRGPKLTDRDVEIIRWITRHGVVTADLVGRRFFWRPQLQAYGRRATYRRLNALCRLGLILDKKEYGTPHNVIRTTRVGARLADVGVRPAPFVLSELQHTLAVVALGEYLLHENPGAELTTERELRVERLKQTLASTREHGRGRVPDAVLRLRPDARGVRESIAVELDLTRKDQRTIEHIIGQFAFETFDRVWWYVRPVRVERMQTIVRALHADQRVEVRPWHG
ncbi:MAG TPA: hypothetical protein VGY54_04825 [Polyangiaceae bacterium]|jgi:hypothetical protein|nr:hypothetical protein [Polyangiaceae bacterium]